MSTRYPGEPTNSFIEHQVHEALKNPNAGMYFPPNSIPQRAVLTPLVTELPIAPADGDEIRYHADATVGVVWSFRWRAAVQIWEFTGGMPLIGRTDTLETETSTTYDDLSGGVTGPSIVLPFAGDYVIELGTQCFNNTVNGSCFMAPQTTTTAAANVNAILHTSSTANAFGTPCRTDVTFTGQSAGETLIAKYQVSAGTGSFLRRWIKCRPIRVGRV